ncbi:hypothetical protein [Natronosalvus rutilus]|uniref:Uncharacterized protein n=1 Tax=Natronosalvus rutilus TaxID=2953753 RepID=A0A9E7SUA1_9EURY|nr:hypothetical protein [Natronosalvus rutilus]UTF54549.1 hypothetical protein NGM29_04550 [Natronosalvus rutilus]
MDEEHDTAANENTRDEAELIAWIEQRRGRELTEEETSLSLAQARLIGEL